MVTSLAPTPGVGPHESDAQRRFGRSSTLRWQLLFLFVFVPIFPLFAHGCHGDDLDNEPMVFIPDEGHAGGPLPGK
jgi:hypothetical protein